MGYKEEARRYVEHSKKLEVEIERLKTLWEETGKIIAFLKTDDETIEVAYDLEKLKKEALGE